jgi:hypothetical protein
MDLDGIGEVGDRASEEKASGVYYPLNLRFYQKGGLLPKYFTTKIQSINSN